MTNFLAALGQFGQPLSIVTLLLRIGVAVLIGAIIGIDREIKNRPAGMRTHVLVCVGAALVAMIECQSIADAVARVTRRLASAWDALRPPLYQASVFWARERFL